MDYNKHTWVKGELIDADKMNNIENGIENGVSKTGDTMTGRLNSKNLNVYNGSWPGIGFALATNPTSSIVSLNYDQSEQMFTFISHPANDSSTTEAFRLPAPTYSDSGYHIFGILTEKTPVTITQGGTGARTADAARIALSVYSKSEVDALISGGATPSGDYLPISGGTLSGNLNLSSTTASLCVGSTNGSAGVRIFRDNEGGNIALWSPNGTGWQMDAFNNTAFRIYHNVGTPSWSFVNTGGFQIEGAQAPIITLKSNVVDIKSTTNNLSSAIYPAIVWLDKNGATTCRLENGLSMDGSSFFYLYTRNYNSAGTDSGLRGLKYTLTNANVGSWVISDPAAFRSALSIGSVTDSNVWLVNTSRTANTVLAAPNGSAGSASFRALVAADIPSLSASKITSGTMTGTISISETSVSGGCNIKSTAIDLSSTTNGISSIYQPGFIIQDKNARSVAYFRGYVQSNGKTGYRIGATQYNTSGTATESAVIGVDIAKDGTQTWVFPLSFRQSVLPYFVDGGTWATAYSNAKVMIKVVFGVNYSGSVHILVIDIPKNLVTSTGRFFFSSSCVHDGKQLFAQGMYSTSGAQYEYVILGSDVQTSASVMYYYYI